MIAHIFTCSLGLNQWRSFLKCTERENAENAEKSSSSIRLKQVTQLVLNPFFFFFPQNPTLNCSDPTLGKVWSGKSGAGVPSAGTAAPGDKGALTCRDWREREGGWKEGEDRQNLNIWANAEKNPECLDQVCFSILHCSRMTAQQEGQLLKIYSLFLF